MPTTPCSHCGLVFDTSVMIQDGDLHFCCKGCQGVYHLLQDDGLGSFYARKGSVKLSPVEANQNELESFDYESFEKRYIKTTPSGHAKINLIIEGIHCSACVWLNEKVLNDTDGIIEASINFTTHKATIVWDKEHIKLSEIIHRIRSIGYNAYPYEISKNEIKANSTKRDYYTRLIVAVFGSMNIMTIALAKYGGFFTGIDYAVERVLELFEFIIATPVLFYSGWVYYKGAYYGLKNRFINMDFLVATGASLTYLYSIYALFSEEAMTYFDSVTMIITFVLVGKYLEVVSKKSIIDTLDTLTSSIPQDCLVVKGDEKVLTQVSSVEVGDIIEIKAGEKCVIDGVILSGAGNFDESSMSGESLPVYKKTHDTILSGAILLDSTLRYQATKTYENSTLYTLINLTQDAIEKKPNIENISNRISGKFSLAIFTIAIATFVGWYALGSGFERSLIVAISVIVIACPCALALATPIATLVGIGTATSNKLIFKEAKHLETLSLVDTVVLDKTGTLTQGKLNVVDFTTYEGFEPNVVYALAGSSRHPVSLAIAKYLTTHYPALIAPELDELTLIASKGIVATHQNQTLIAGSVEFLQEHGLVLNSYTLSHTTFGVMMDGKLLLLASLEDQLKEGAKELVDYLKKHRITPIMLTGDNQYVANKIASQIGIEAYKSNLTPFDKATYIDNLKKNGKRVVMVGDGINDALALSKADIAISMGSGADIAIEVGDIILLDNSLFTLVNAFIIAKRTLRNIKENLSLSFVYNSITIPFAVAGFVIPMIAALSMSLSSLLVVANSFRIKHKKVKYGR